MTPSTTTSTTPSTTTSTTSTTTPSTTTSTTPSTTTSTTSTTTPSTTTSTTPSTTTSTTSTTTPSTTTSTTSTTTPSTTTSTTPSTTTSTTPSTTTSTTPSTTTSTTSTTTPSTTTSTTSTTTPSTTTSTTPSTTTSTTSTTTPSTTTSTTPSTTTSTTSTTTPSTTTSTTPSTTTSTTPSTTTSTTSTTTPSTTTSTTPSTTTSTTSTTTPSTTTSTTSTTTPSTTTSTTPSTTTSTTPSTTTSTTSTTTPSTTTSTTPSTTTSTTSTTTPSTTTSTTSTTTPSTTTSTTPSTTTSTTSTTTPSTTTSTTPSTTTSTTSTTTPSTTTSTTSTTTPSTTTSTTPSTTTSTTPSTTTSTTPSTTTSTTSTTTPSTTTSTTSTTTPSTTTSTTPSTTTSTTSTTTPSTTTSTTPSTTTSTTSTTTPSTTTSTTSTTTPSTTTSTTPSTTTTTTSTTTPSTTATDSFTNSITEIPTTSSRPNCCPKNGLWSEWLAEGECSSPCGSCAQQTLRRRCVSEESGCSCNGTDVVVRNCNLNVCDYPRDDCCPGFKLVFDQGDFICGPQPKEVEEPSDTTCCPPGGFWSLWGEWSSCENGQCGMCGTATRNRTCFSDKFGCSCDEGEDTEAKSCRVLASWSEWTETVSCNNATCGSCDYRVLTRTCDRSNGCYCIGSDIKTEVCNTSPCNGTICCSGFSKMTILPGGVTFCGPLIDNHIEEVMETCPETGECCVMGGIWSEWSNGDACTATCGRCGDTTRTRFCISKDWGCECAGESTKSGDCAPIACNSTTPCCNGKDPIIMNGALVCASSDIVQPDPSDLCWTDCCPKPGGYWSEWYDVDTCSDTCGSCGTFTQKRLCLTDIYGCDCNGNDTRKVVCNPGVCYFPRDVCCSPYESMVINEKHSCGPLPNYTTPIRQYDPYCNATCCAETGVWSEWTLTPNQCTDYCGSCGNMTKTRICISEDDGCPCQGHSIEISQCNIGLCYFPRLQCCPGYESTAINGKHVCGPVAIQPNEVPYLNTCGVECCPTAGIWGEWYTVIPCTDTCGSCGTMKRERKCLSMRYGCSCSGDNTKTSVCGTQTCMYPKPPCCAPYTKRIDPATKQIICGPVPADPAFNPEQTTCCDPEKTGLWNEWKDWTACSGSCGLCGTQTRNRTCASAPYGCPCVGNVLETRSCGQPVCSSGSKCCAGKFLAVAYDGTEFCQNEKPMTCPGKWTDWMPQAAAYCNDTCGMCGKITSFRYCWPSGCQCSGPFFEDRPCAQAVCMAPRPPCCPGYTRKIVSGKIVCV